MTDGEMDRWHEIYQANNVRRRRSDMTFEQFLVNPRGYLQALIFGQAFPLADDEEFYPLLPAQRAVAARVAAADSVDFLAGTIQAELLAHVDVRYQENHFIEPLRHHARGVQREARRIT